MNRLCKICKMYIRIYQLARIWPDFMGNKFVVFFSLKMFSRIFFQEFLNRKLRRNKSKFIFMKNLKWIRYNCQIDNISRNIERNQIVLSSIKKNYSSRFDYLFEFTTNYSIFLKKFFSDFHSNTLLPVDRIFPAQSILNNP